MKSMFCPVELSRLKPFCLPPCPGELVYLFPAPLANNDKASSDDYAERDKASRYDAQRVVQNNVQYFHLQTVQKNGVAGLISRALCGGLEYYAGRIHQADAMYGLYFS